MEKFDLVDFENALILKNQLVSMPLDELKKLYTPSGDYVVLIDTLINLVNSEPIYFYLAPVLFDNVLSLIDINRFNIDSSEIRESINSLIVEINRMKIADENYKKTLVKNYKLYQEKMRKFVFKSNEALLYSLYLDAIVFENLMGAVDAVVDENMFFASINYFTSYCPDIFKNETIRSNAFLIIDNLSQNIAPLDLITKKYVKNTTNSIKKIKEEE